MTNINIIILLYNKKSYFYLLYNIINKLLLFKIMDLPFKSILLKKIGSLFSPGLSLFFSKAIKFVI